MNACGLRRRCYQGRRSSEPDKTAPTHGTPRLLNTLFAGANRPSRGPAADTGLVGPGDRSASLPHLVLQALTDSHGRHTLAFRVFGDVRFARFVATWNPNWEACRQVEPMRRFAKGSRATSAGSTPKAMPRGTSTGPRVPRSQRCLRKSSGITHAKLQSARNGRSSPSNRPQKFPRY